MSAEFEMNVKPVTPTGQLLSLLSATDGQCREII